MCLRPHFALDIKTNSSKGLILHAAGRGVVPLLALYLANGKLRMSLGKNRIIQHKQKSNDGNWHRVTDRFLSLLSAATLFKASSSHTEYAVYNENNNINILLPLPAFLWLEVVISLSLANEQLLYICGVVVSLRRPVDQLW